MKRKRWCVWVRFRNANETAWEKTWYRIAIFENPSNMAVSASELAIEYKDAAWPSPGQAVVLPEGRKPKGAK